MHLAVITWKPIYPVDTALAVRDNQLYKYLKKWEWSIAAPGPSHPHIPMFQIPRHWLTILPWPWSPEVFNLWGNSYLKLIDHYKKNPPDVVLAEGPWAASSAKKVANYFKVPLIVVVFDIEHLSTKGSGRGPFRRILVKFMESRAYKLADMLGYMTEEDRKILVSTFKLDNTPMVHLPQGADVDSLMKEGAALHKEWKIEDNEKVILFYGQLDYPPNLYALKWLNEEIAPVVKKQNPSVRFIIGGRNQPKEKMENLKFLGVIPDLSAALRTADICIAPIKSGTGIRTKIIEYLAAEKPVVTTSVGDVGIGTENGVHLLRRDKAEDFAEAICELLNSPDKGIQIAKRGHKFIKENYDWAIIAQRLEDTLDDLVK